MRRHPVLSPLAAFGAAYSILVAAVGRPDEQCQSQKARLQDVVEKYTGANKKAVGDHNQLADDYNALLKNHNDMINNYNRLITDLDDPSLPNFITAKALATSRHPGIEGAVNKTRIYVLPAAREKFLNGHRIGTEWLNQTQLTVQSFLENYSGEAAEDWLPLMSGFIVYGSVLIPAIVAFWCVLEFVCRLQLLLNFGHIYLAVASGSLAAFAMLAGEDPLRTFAAHDFQLYQFSQCAFAVMLILYGTVSCVALCLGNEESWWRGCQLLVTLLFAAAYYSLIWTPAMMDEMPKVTEFVYALIAKSGAAPGAGAGRLHMSLLAAAPYSAAGAIFSVLFIFENSSMVKVETAENKAE